MIFTRKSEHPWEMVYFLVILLAKYNFAFFLEFQAEPTRLTTTRPNSLSLYHFERSNPAFCLLRVL